MRIFGYVKELVEVWFRKDSQDVKLTPNSGTYSATTTLTLPPVLSGSDELVGRTATQILTNKELTAPIVSTISNTGTLTLPTITDTLVGRITADQGAARLKNKDLEANTLAVVNAADTTKKIKFGPGGTTGTATTLASVQTVDINVTLPDISDTLVARTTTDTLTNKSISGATNTLSAIPNGATTATNANTASAIVARDVSGNFSAGTITATLTGNATNVSGTVAIGNGGTGQITANAAANALLPAQTGNSGRFLKTDGSNTNWASATGSGSGEINAVSNPSAADGDLTGWTAGTSHTQAAQTGAGPLNPIVTTSIRVQSSAATAESSTSGVRFDITSLPVALQNKKLKCEFYVFSPNTTDVWKMSVYQGTTRLALSTDSSGSTTIPANFTGKFTAYFDTTSAATYSVNFTNTTRVGLSSFDVAGLIVGPGIQPQGAVVGDWVTYTPTGSWTTNTTYVGRKRRVGNVSEYEVSVQLAGAPTATGLLINQPTGETIDSSQVPDTGRGIVGTAVLFDADGAAAGRVLGEVAYNATTNSRVNLMPTGSGSAHYMDQASATFPVTMATGDRILVSYSVPISEWAGSGTVNLAQNDVEYASNSSTATTGDDATSFAYGPDGTAFVGVTAAGKRTVRFKTPIQTTDQLTLEVQSGTGYPWVALTAQDLSSGLGPLIYQGADTYGVGINGSGTNVSTDVQVAIGDYAYANNASTYSAAGAAWSGFTGWRWRVKKVSGGQAVGFGLATATQSGLVLGGKVPGSTSGTAISAGYVGETINTTTSAIAPDTSATFKQVQSISLTAGVWLVVGGCRVSNNATGTTWTDDFTAVISNVSASDSGVVYGYAGTAVAPTILTANKNVATVYVQDVFNISTTTTIYLNANAYYSSGAPVFRGSLKAIRIA
jgi:hypothetical protein